MARGAEYVPDLVDLFMVDFQYRVLGTLKLKGVLARSDRTDSKISPVYYLLYGMQP